MVALSPATSPPEATEVNNEPVLEVHNLYRFFHSGDEEVQALRGVSLSVRAGEFVALLGPSGSGKSTLLACIAGLDDPDGGVVHVAGERLSRRTERERARLRREYIGVLLQSGNLLEHLSVVDNIRVVQALDRRNRRSDLDRSPDDLLSSVGLGNRTGAAPTTLSGGEAARAGLAAALARNPLVLLADEPTAEVDVANEAAVIELLVAEAKKGVALIVTTHSPRLAAAAQRLVRLRDGVIVDE